MVPILLTRSQINTQEWDTFIRSSQQRIIYGLSWYLDTVSEDWNALVWPAKENYQIVMPLPVKKKWNLAVVEQPLFCQYLGLFSVSDLTTQQAFGFLKALSSHFSYISTYSFHPLNQKVVSEVLPKLTEFKLLTNHTFWLSLQNPYETIRTGYSYDRKLNSRRAEKYDWILERSDDPDTLIDLFTNHHQSKITGGVSPKAYVLFKKLAQRLLIENCAELWYACKNNVRHGGALFVLEGEMVVYLFNSADGAGRKGNARTYLIDLFLKNYADRDMNLDFESPEVEAISNFYRSFGGKRMSYTAISKNKLPVPFRQIQYWRKKILLKTR